MGKTRFFAIVLVIVMLTPVLTSCRAGKNKNNVVKADDPWYESSKFELKMDLQKNDLLASSVVYTCNDKLFSAYVMTPDRFATTRSLLDTYDYEGNLLSRKKITCPDGFRAQDIYCINSDQEGKTLRAAAYINSAEKRGFAFLDIDPETGNVTNIKMIERKSKFPGASIFYIDYVGEYAFVTLDVSDSPASPVYCLALYKDNELCGEIDMTADKVIHIAGYSVDESTDSVYVAAVEREGLFSLEYDLYTGNLKSRTNLLESDGKTVNLAEYTLTDNGDYCKLDSRGNIVKADIKSMTSQTAIDVNWYDPFFYPSNTGFSYSVTPQLLSCTEDRAVILDTKTVMFANIDPDNTMYITVLKKADKNPHAGKEIIEIALPLYESGMSDYLARAIYEFNRTDTEYLIRVWDKYKTGKTLGRMIPDRDENDTELYEMIQDLKGDDAPDIAVGIQKKYAMNDEVFMDLTGFLDPEVVDKQYSNIFEAGRINGKLYFLPVTLQIEGLVTKADLLEDGAVGITFEDYGKMVKDKLYGFSPYDYPDSEYFNKRAFILSCIDTKSAIEGDKIDFGTGQFRSAVEYAKDNFTYDDVSSTPEDYLHDWVKRPRERCYYAKLDSYYGFVKACYNSNGKYVIIGTPSVDASGPRFKALETVSVSATTDVKDGCKKFLNYLFSGKAYDSADCGFLNIVTNKEIMNRNIESITKLNNDFFERYETAKKNGVIIVPGYVEKAEGDKLATDEMRESFLNSMSTISTYYYEDHEIVKFVMEELAPYYAGDRSFDDAVRILNDRTAKYVKEM